MRSSFSAGIGFSLFLSGMAVFQAGPVAVQPILLLAPAYLLVALAAGPRLGPGVLVWLLAGLVSLALGTLFSGDPRYSAFYFVIQAMPLLLFGLTFGLILSRTDDTGAFLSGYVLGAAVSSLLCVAQFTSSSVFGVEISVTNNSNFALVAPKGRGVGFTPEAALLAILLIPAIALLYAERGATDSLLPARLRHPALLVLIGAGLVCTRSSSMVLLPLVLLAVDLLRSGNVGGFLKRSRLLVALGGVLLLVFVPLYSLRLERNDAQASTTYRLEKLLAGAEMFLEHPVQGAGLGRVSDAGFFDGYVEHRKDWSWRGEEERKGVDSWTLRLAAEGGLIALIAFYYPLLRPVVPALRRSPAGRALLSLGFALLVMQALISGYRDQPYFYLPLIVFALAGTGALATGRGGTPAPHRPVRQFAPATASTPYRALAPAHSLKGAVNP